ncbi:hypothetical protein EDB86DRAFT_3243913 [Lactarius hatsudake]|nr:hypothetical protein EDB86DRAFT_3243913 [Lactarius hatsudake]
MPLAAMEMMIEGTRVAHCTTRSPTSNNILETRIIPLSQSRNLCKSLRGPLTTKLRLSPSLLKSQSKVLVEEATHVTQPAEESHRSSTRCGGDSETTGKPEYHRRMPVEQVTTDYLFIAVLVFSRLCIDVGLCVGQVGPSTRKVHKYEITKPVDRGHLWIKLGVSGSLWWGCMRRRRPFVGARIAILAFTAATTVKSGQFAALSPSSLLLPRQRCRHDLGYTLTVACLGVVVVMGVGDGITCRAPPSSSAVAIAGDTRDRAIAAVTPESGLALAERDPTHVVGVVVAVGRVMELTATIAHDSKKSGNTSTPTKALMF